MSSWSRSPWRNKRYSALPTTEDEQPVLYTHSHLWQYFLVILLTTNAVSIFSVYTSTKLSTMRAYSQDIEGIEKAFPGLDRSLLWMNFSDFTVNSTSRWTAAPSREVDRAWKELGVSDMGFVVPGDIGQQVFGLNPREHYYVPKGSLEDPEREGFPLFMQGLHDLHCLNELRKALHFNHDYYRQFQNNTMESVWFRISHINHCLDNLRERLMCTADVGVIPNVWIGSRPGKKFIQFKRQHKCHDYGSLMRWVNSWHEGEGKHDILPKGKHIPTPPDVIYHDPQEFGL